VIDDVRFLSGKTTETIAPRLPGSTRKKFKTCRGHLELSCPVRSVHQHHHISAGRLIQRPRRLPFERRRRVRHPPARLSAAAAPSARASTPLAGRRYAAATAAVNGKRAPQRLLVRRALGGGGLIITAPAGEARTGTAVPVGTTPNRADRYCHRAARHDCLAASPCGDTVPVGRDAVQPRVSGAGHAYAVARGMAGVGRAAGEPSRANMAMSMAQCAQELQSAQFWPIRARTRTHDVFKLSYIICRFSSKSHEPSRYQLNEKLFRFEDQVGSRRSRRRRRDGSSSRFTVRRFTLCRCPRRVAVRAAVPSIIRVVTS